MQPVDFVRQGVSVIPIAPLDKVPAITRWEPYQHRLTTDAELARWTHPARQYNLAVVCGHRGLTVSDFDSMVEYYDWRRWAITRGGMASEVARTTLKCRTRRGVHVYVLCKQRVRCGKFSGGDVKGFGGYVVIPDSSLPGGFRYVWMDPAAPIVEVDALDDFLPDYDRSIVMRAAPATPAPPVATYATGALYPMTLIERIKDAVPITDYLENVKPYRGRWWSARCPFHGDTSNSLKVDLRDRVISCFVTTCEAHRPIDVIEVYRRLNNCDVRTAVHELAKRL